jgi:hypothetical protein
MRQACLGHRFNSIGGCKVICATLSSATSIIAWVPSRVKQTQQDHWVCAPLCCLTQLVCVHFETARPPDGTRRCIRAPLKQKAKRAYVTANRRLSWIPPGEYERRDRTLPYRSSYNAGPIRAMTGNESSNQQAAPQDDESWPAHSYPAPSQNPRISTNSRGVTISQRDHSCKRLWHPSPSNLRPACARFGIVLECTKCNL